ncbi:EXPA32 [Linum grandiflorum]
MSNEHRKILPLCIISLLENPNINMATNSFRISTWKALASTIMVMITFFVDDCVAHEWKRAHATFYEGGPSTFGGACDFKDTQQLGYGMNTAAVSSALFKKGESCGACFELRCVDDPKWCKLGPQTLVVTATDHCPPNPSLPNDAGGWCNPPLEHFDIAKPAFHTLAEEKSGIIPVEYRRVPCLKQGGMKFSFSGNPWFIQVVISNVGGAGDVKNVMVKEEGGRGEWTRMERDWGETWKTDNHELVGKCLTFKVRTSDGRSVTAVNAAPKDWQFGQTYQSRENF